MKYALGTVLGTALLGLAKSKLGSGVKLKVQEFLEIKMRYILEFNPDDLANEDEDEDEELREAIRIVNSIIDKVLTTKTAKITDIKYVNSYHADGEYGPETHVVIDVYATIKKPENAELIDLKVEQIDLTCQRLLYLNFEDKSWMGFSIHNYGDPEYQVKKVIVDSETGEPYTTPTPPKSKLRKR